MSKNSSNSTGGTPVLEKAVSSILVKSVASEILPKTRYAVTTVSMDAFEEGTTRIQELLDTFDENLAEEEQCVENAREQNKGCNSIKELIFEASLPAYFPIIQRNEPYSMRNCFNCKECGDKFVMESSLVFHMERRSILISYECLDCGSTVTVYNRCSLLAHFRLHADPGNYFFDSLKITVSPLPRDKMLIGPLPKITTDDNGCVVPLTINSSSNTSGSKEQVVDIEVELEHCVECNLTPKGSLRDHIIGSNLPLDPNIKCKECNLILPTKCSLKAHERCHKQQRPFICPECAKLFHLWASFAVHLYYTCFHMDKCIRFRCPQCTYLHPTSVSLEVHILTVHVKNVFKCNACPIACFSILALQDHKTKCHKQPSLPTNAYQQCQLCPDRLIPKSRLLFHVIEHVKKPEVRVYGYVCSTCKCFLLKKNDFATHKSKCPSGKGRPDDPKPNSVTGSAVGKSYDSGKTIQSAKSGNGMTEGVKILQTVKPRSLTFTCTDTIKSSNSTPSKVISKRFPIKIAPKNTYSFINKTVIPLISKGSLTSVSSNLARSPIIQNGVKKLIKPNSVAVMAKSRPLDESQIVMPAVLQTQAMEKDPLSLDDVEESIVPSTSLLKGKGTILVPNGKYFVHMCVVCRKELVFNSPISRSSSQFPAHCATCSKEKLLNKPKKFFKSYFNINKNTPHAVKELKPVKSLPPSIVDKLKKEKSYSIALNGPSNKKFKVASNSSGESDRFKCHICKSLISMDWDVIQSHFAREHKNFNLMVLSPRLQKMDIDTKTGKPLIVKEALQTKTSMIKRAVSNPESNATSGRELDTNGRSESPKFKRKKKNKEKTNIVTPFSSGQVIKTPIETNTSSKFTCSKCKFTHEDMKIFRSHILTHKSDSRSYQCMECSMCFVVKPSFEKHLFIYHRIKDVESYIEQNSLCHPKHKTDSEETEEYLKAKEELEENQCSVCKLQCENAVQLNKHFRSHGMAFLLMKQRENKIALQTNC